MLECGVAFSLLSNAVEDGGATLVQLAQRGGWSRFEPGVGLC
jgi:hypothetical protein